MSKFQINLSKQKETKGTVVYAEQAQDGAEEKIPTVYIKKSAAADLGNPDNITLTVEAK